MENRTRSAKLMNITAMAAFGTLGYFVAKIPLASEEIAFFRAVIAAVVILAWQLVRGRKFRLPASRKSLILLMASGAMIGFNWIFLFEAYHYTSVSVATLSYYFAPVIVMAACPLLFRERLSLKQIICFACSTAGLVLVISSGGLEGGSSNVTGVGYGLGAAVLYACMKRQEAAILSYIDPMVACAMSVFVMGEAMGLMQAAGGVMILGFTLYNELGGKTPSHPRQKTGCE